MQTKKKIDEKPRFAPTLCLTHNCNLNCIYCYQKHDTQKHMSFETAKKCIDWIFSNISEEYDGVELDFSGGEPLLDFGVHEPETARVVLAYLRVEAVGDNHDGILAPGLLVLRYGLNLREGCGG